MNQERQTLDVTHSESLLEIQGLSKSFPGVRALNDVSLSLRDGEVLAVIGENGAGKSTLMKILAGVQKADQGTVSLSGNPVVFDSVEESLDQGISLIHQELNLADNLSVGANIFLGREPTKWGLIDEKKIANDSKVFLEKVGLNCSPQTPLHTLTIGKQQLVEIAKALSTNARILIMDEPTSSLSQHETNSLFKVVKDLKQQGVSVIYISHRLNEVEELADRVVVLRDGENAGELEGGDIHRDKMVPMMVGRDISQFYERSSHTPGDIVLDVKSVITPEFPTHEVSFQVRAGEVVGIAGLVGAGRTELLRVLFGINAPLGGTVSVSGQQIQPDSPKSAIEAGMALVPEDRKSEGLVLGIDIQRNISLPSMKRDQWAFFLHNQKAERTEAAKAIKKLLIKTPSSTTNIETLSGGNQQKVVLGKWLGMNPKILLLDEPTRGIDVGSKEEIYKLIDSLAAEGLAILFASSEMDEVIGLSDRVLVMHEGNLTGELHRDGLTEVRIMELATGGLLETTPQSVAKN